MWRGWSDLRGSKKEKVFGEQHRKDETLAAPIYHGFLLPNSRERQSNLSPAYTPRAVRKSTWPFCPFVQTAERLATSRLWTVAGPTQVRPMSFFEDPNLREFLLEPESLRRIREAAFIDDGSLIRK